MGRYVGPFISPLLWKCLVLALGASFAVVNVTVDTADLITLPAEEETFQRSGIKAAGFAIITAIALFAGSIPTGEGRVDRIVDSAARILGILTTGGAGWYWLHGETYGNPGKYLYGILILTVAAAVTVLIWGGIYALLAIVAHGVATMIRGKLASFSRFARGALSLQRRR